MDNISLVCALGTTPQILSETLYCLWVQKKLYVSRIKVITTEKGYNEIEKNFLRPGKSKLVEFARNYDYPDVKKIFTEDDIVILGREGQSPLSDIRTSEDSELSMQIIMDNMQRWTADDQNKIYCSVAGGRKTMGIQLAYALQLFGRKEDRLFHVLVHPSLENNRLFFYPEPDKDYGVPEGEPIIELTELPFIMLRERLARLAEIKRVTYNEWVRAIQADLNSIPQPPSIEFNYRKRKIIINKEFEIKLPLQNFTVYSAFFDMKLNYCQKPDKKICGDCTECYQEIGTGCLSKEYLIEKYTKYAKPRSPQVEKFRKRLDFDPTRFETIKQVILEIISKIKSETQKQLSKGKLYNIYDYLEIKSTGHYGSTRYGIKLDKNFIKCI